MKNQYQPSTYRAPSPDRVPVPLRPYVDRLNDARDKWREATDRAAAAQRRAATEPAAAMAAAVAAAADGRPAPAASNTADLERDAEIATAALDVCAHKVREAWHAMALFCIDNRAQLLPLADAEPLAISADVVVAEHALANVKHRYADSLGVRQWLGAMCRPRGAGAILSGTNGPRPRPGMTLREIHEAEAKYAPEVIEAADDTTPDTEPVLVLASDVNTTDAEGDADVLDTEADESQPDAVIDVETPNADAEALDAEALSEGDAMLSDTAAPDESPEADSEVLDGEAIDAEVLSEGDTEAEPDALAPEATETPTGDGDNSEVIDADAEGDAIDTPTGDEPETPTGDSGDTPVLDGDVSTDDGEPIAEDDN